ncbi:MAG: TonB-dependent receptor [Gammaproteobacteria bacterium]|nr:TonB-dependent receptor [Gammaproteobacteria bacterium]
MLRALFVRREMRTARAVRLSGVLLASITELAWGQATTPTQPPQQSETDIGRVTTLPGQGENEAVVPSATTTRAAALEMKRQAPNIIEVQPLSEIIKLPDINMAEALQRIPGISLETDSGEGRFINIRGLDADLNASTYAGVRLPASNPASPFGGGRATAFDTFPTGIVGGVEVTKTLRPDMDAEGLGGSINLVPRTGAQHGGRPFFEADIGGGYQPLRRTPIYHGEISTGTSFSGGDGIGGLFAGAEAFSVVLTGVIHSDQRGVDDVERSYSDNQSAGVPDKVLSNLQFRWYKYARMRYGTAANFDARASDSTSLYLRVLWSGYLEHGRKHFLVLNGLDSGNGQCASPAGQACFQDPNNPNGYLASAATLEQDTTDSVERIQNALAIFGGSSTFTGFRVDYRGSYAMGSDRYSVSPGSTWTYGGSSNLVGVPIAYDNVSNPKYPSYHTLDGTDPANPALYQLDNIGLGPSYAKDGEWAGAIDVTIPTGSGTHSAEWKFGLSGRWRHTTFEATAPSWTPDGVILLPPYTFGAPQVFYNGHYTIGPWINLDQVAALYGSSLGTISTDPAADASTDTDDDENVYAAYGQYQGRHDGWGWLAGVRVESTHATYRGNLYNSDLDSNTPATQSNSYTNAFPTLQGRYFFSEQLIARLTYASGIARPGFNQITPGAMVSTVNRTVTVGNPALKPTVGQNFDATLEWFPRNGQIASVGVFGKVFTNYILQTEQRVDSYPFPGLGPSGTPVVVDSFVNGPAHAWGAEAQYQQQLLFLPRPWDGLGFSLNGTAVDSRAQIHPGVYGLLPSTAKFTWNAALFYESGPLELRVAFDYVGQNLFAFGSVTSNATDVYSSARLTMDLGASYVVSRRVSVYFQAKNLLNTPLEFTEGPCSCRPIQREFYDATYLAGVRLQFD